MLWSSKRWQAHRALVQRVRACWWPNKSVVPSRASRKSRPISTRMRHSNAEARIVPVARSRVAPTSCTELVLSCPMRLTCGDALRVRFRSLTRLSLSVWSCGAWLQTP